MNMKHKKSYLIKTFLAAACFLFTSSSCSQASTAKVSPAQTVLVGSTPGDSGIKSLLRISTDNPVDFIRWDLTLNEAGDGSKTYVLDVVYGEGEPNTRGFKGGGEKLSLAGIYTARKSRKGEIYELKNETAAISLVKLNDNLFHVLTPDQRLMVGNGGWSYTLSRKESSANNSPILPAWTPSPPEETAAGQVIFDGRTPCLDFAREFNLQVGNDCFKLKWKLTLFRDSKTNQPTTYNLQSTLNRTGIREGKWTIIKGVKNNPGAIIYRLNPDEPIKAVSFLVGDENVLFFLDRENRLFTGNSDFSFTLNRRKS